MKNLHIILILIILLIGVLFLEDKVEKIKLKTGDIAFIHFDSEGNDGFKIVALNDIKSYTTIYFTDAEWNGNRFGIDEHVITWNTGSQKIFKGTIVDFKLLNTTPKSSYGTLTNILKISKKSEALFAYTGLAPRVPEVFLSALANDSLAYGTLINTGLVDGETALTLPKGTYYASAKNAVLQQPAASIYNIINFDIKRSDSSLLNYRYVSYD